MIKIETKETFAEKIKGTRPSIMKFTAGWCPDCRRMDMFIDDIVQEHDDKEWFEVDRDKFPELAQKYEVMGIPSLLVFENGEKTAHLHSATAKTPEQVRDFLKEV